MRNILIFLAGLLPAGLVAQQKPVFRLSCPVNNATEVFEKQAFDMGKELKIILSSTTDTTVKAGIAGVITNVLREEGNKWSVVLNFKDYYVWYLRLSTVSVREGQKIKNGDMIGNINAGGKVELHVFDFETPVEPKSFLDCKLK